MKLFLNINPKLIAESITPIQKVAIDEIQEIENSIDTHIGSEIKIPKDVLNSFKLKKTLNTDIWTKDELNPIVKQKLIKIAKDFYKDLELPKDIRIKDIIFTGSLANFNWSKYSDIDLHIVLEFNKFDANLEMVENYFYAQKAIWNQEHDITIFDFPVEIYVQDKNAKLRATAIYSVLYDKWILKPEYENFKIDKKAIKDKADTFIHYLRDIRQHYNDKHYQTVIDMVTKLKTKIKNMRNAGLETGGEFSLENLVFKVLRRTPFMDYLDSYKAKSYDTLMSVTEGVKSPTNDGLFVFDNAKKFAEDFLGVNLIYQLGVGGNGAAYLTNKNTKIKFTYSENEYEFAKENIGRRFNYTADYYMAEEISDGLYVIEMEFIDELPEDMYDDLSNTLNSSSDKYENDINRIYSELGGKANDLNHIGNFGIKNGELATFDPVAEDEELLDEGNDRYAKKQDYYNALFKQAKVKELYGGDPYWENIEDGQFVGVAVVGITGQVSIKTHLAQAGEIRRLNLGMSEKPQYLTFTVMAGRGIEHKGTFTQNTQPARTRQGIGSDEFQTEFNIPLPNGISLENGATSIKIGIPLPGSPASDAAIKTWLVYGDIIVDFVERNMKHRIGYKDGKASDISKEKMADNPKLQRHKQKKDLEMELGRRVTDSEFQNFLSSGQKPMNKKQSFSIDPATAADDEKRRQATADKIARIKARRGL
jgi:predicted nucleotidyltransferase